jgi:hypothetical protein
MGLLSGLLPAGFPIITPYTPLLAFIRASFPAHLNLLNVITRKIFVEKHRVLSSSLCNLLRFPVASSLLGPNIFLITLNLNSSLFESNQVSQPYKTTGKIIVQCMLIVIFLDSKLEHKSFDILLLRKIYRVLYGTTNTPHKV